MPATRSRPGAPPQGPAAATTVVTLVHAQGCHFCADAREVLAELCRELPLRVTVVDAGTPAGMRLVAAFRPSLYPLVLVDGAFFSQGRLPRRKLVALLSRRAGAAVRQ